MITVPFGTTGINVSACCLGAMNMGSRIPEETSRQILDLYYGAGGRFIDTANVYTAWIDGGKAGDSESLLGRWMRDRGNRSEIFLASKVGLAYEGVPFGLTAALIEQECEKSLRNLGVETLDLYYSHRDDRATPLEETLAAYDKLVRAGKVRFIGASNFMAWRLAQARALSDARGWASYSCVQQRLTYLRLNPAGAFSERLDADRELLDLARAEKVPIVAFSPLLKGALSRTDRQIPKEYAGADTDRRLAALRSIAQETGATVNQIALAWLLRHQAPIIPLFSASSTAQIQENLGALAVTLSPESRQTLDNA